MGYTSCKDDILAFALCISILFGSYPAGQEGSAPQSRQPEQPPPNIEIFNLIYRYFICRKTSKNTKIRSFSCRLQCKMNCIAILKRQCYKISTLKVVGNEKEGGSGRCQTFPICLWPRRSMFFSVLILLLSLILCFSVSAPVKQNQCPNK